MRPLILLSLCVGCAGSSKGGALSAVLSEGVVLDPKLSSARSSRRTPRSRAAPRG